MVNLEKWIIWCDLNDEQDELEKLFGDSAVSVRGSTSPNKKIELEKEWREGDVPIFISKPSIFGQGLNWQNCRNMVFVGLSDSFEQVFQAIRRCWRFGQDREVNVYIVISEQEGAVLENIKRKEKDFEIMQDGMIKFTKTINAENIKSTTVEKTDYKPSKQMKLPDFLKGA